MPFPFFWKRTRPAWQVILYTRQNCPLCDEAWHFLETEQQKHGFALEARDIDADPELQKEFGECVPVVVINGQIRFRGRINPALWRRLLNA